ncbi:MAG: PD40 domain-containing protein [Alphaproteobacteria bacterium]|nr:PD40 domain-containing protein [Alphaproteobacteria bacterium]
MKTAWMAASLFISASVAAQQMAPDVANNTGPLPGTDIYLAELVMAGDSYSVGAPENITRHKGYDNQPHFMPDGDKILYTSEDKDIRTDIWMYMVDSGTKTRLTNTPDNSEFSPKVMPDGSGFSVIREESYRGGQRVWRYEFGNTEAAEPMLKLSPTGYHAWGMGTRYVAVFVLGEPNTLQLVDRETGNAKVIFENIGRGLFSLPDGSGFTFTEAREGGPAKVYHYDIAAERVTPLFDLPGGNDYALMRNAQAPLGVSFMAAHGSKIFYRETPSGAWAQIADMEGLEISRLAVSPDNTKIALVAAE